MNITSPNHIGIPIGKVVDVNKKRIRIQLFKELSQGDGIRFQKEEKGMIVNFIYDKNDKLISKGNIGDTIEIDNKLAITLKDTVLKTVDTKLLKKLENYQEKKIPISIKASASLGNDFYLEISDFIHTVKLSSNIILKATGSGTSKERILEQLTKLGDTPFVVEKCDIDISSSIFVPISKLNELRREAISKLIEIRENTKKEVVVEKPLSLEKEVTDEKIQFMTLVRTEEQLIACIPFSDTIYVTDKNLYEKYKDRGNVYLRLDRVMNFFPEYQNEKLLIGEMGSIQYQSNNMVHSDYYLNVVNSYYVSYLRKLGVSSITLSIENTCDDIKRLIDNAGNKGIQVLVYGRLEAMIMKYCPLKMLVNKDKSVCNVCRNGKKYELVDRNQAHYPLVQEKELTHIFYHQVYSLESSLLELKKMGIKEYRFEFFDENGSQVEDILKKWKSLLS